MCECAAGESVSCCLNINSEFQEHNNYVKILKRIITLMTVEAQPRFQGLSSSRLQGMGVTDTLGTRLFEALILSCCEIQI